MEEAEIGQEQHDELSGEAFPTVGKRKEISNANEYKMNNNGRARKCKEISWFPMQQSLKQSNQICDVDYYLCPICIEKAIAFSNYALFASGHPMQMRHCRRSHGSNR